eukprot:11169661-Lingulodinium_polyedra.AAC.1
MPAQCWRGLPQCPRKGAGGYSIMCRSLSQNGYGIVAVVVAIAAVAAVVAVGAIVAVVAVVAVVVVAVAVA